MAFMIVVLTAFFAAGCQPEEGPHLFSVGETAQISHLGKINHRGEQPNPLYLLNQRPNRFDLPPIVWTDFDIG
jgi:hypothetical protein